MGWAAWDAKIVSICKSSVVVNRLLADSQDSITRSRVFKGTHIKELTRFWSATNLGQTILLLILLTSFKDSNTLIYFEISLRIQFFSSSKY